MKNKLDSMFNRIFSELMDFMYELMLTAILIAVLIMIAIMIHSLVIIFCNIWNESIVFGAFILILIPMVFCIVRKIHKDVKEDKND